MPTPFLRFDDATQSRQHLPLDLLVEGLRWLLIVGVTLLVLALLYGWLSERPGHRTHQLREGWLQQTVSPLPPEITSGDWQAVELPHDWRRQRLRDVGQIWYRFDLRLDESPDELWAIYLPSVSMNAEVHVNGELIGAGGPFEPKVARNWNRPLYFTLPGSMLRTGDNTILVRVVGVPRGTGLFAPFYAGADHAMRASYSTRRFLKITVPIAASLGTALLALATLLIHYSRPDLPVYRWYGAGTLIWSLHNLNLVVVNAPLPPPLWDWLWYVTLGWFVLMIPPYVHGLLGYERPRVERTLFAYGAAGSIALAGLAAWDHYWLDWAGRHVWDSIALAIGVYPTFMMAQAVWRSRDLEVQVLLTTGLLIFVLGFRDLLAINDLISREDGYMIQYSAPMVIAVFGWLLLSRFLRSTGEVDALNRDLQARVEQRTTELRESFERLSSLQKDQAIQAERERILRDMHDGVGGSLVTAIAIAESGEAKPDELAETLRDALDELRTTIDAMDIEQGDIDAALAGLKARLRPLLEHGSPKLHWDCEPLPPAPDIGPEGLTDLVRIVREAVSNACRHACAATIRVQARHEPCAGGGRIRIEIDDDGSGIDSFERAGHGLGNIRRRAEELGASLEILSSRSGTRVVVLLPIRSPA
ncbi:sensor histidine kinase [Sinimarinibacterium flocculans]|uniref:sensor histidine kinase n=1 Tax=Sinimarinibacterium flocculans TaxID=985250 RepID=UPI0024906B60|nr:ATP-binding protein [Sinimarinibacterium flocculans]